jgi:hypothetical protein
MVSPELAATALIRQSDRAGDVAVTAPSTFGNGESVADRTCCRQAQARAKLREAEKSPLDLPLHLT